MDTAGCHQSECARTGAARTRVRGEAHAHLLDERELTVVAVLAILAQALRVTMRAWLVTLAIARSRDRTIAFARACTHKDINRVRQSSAVFLWRAIRRLAGCALERRVVQLIHGSRRKLRAPTSACVAGQRLELVRA